MTDVTILPSSSPVPSDAATIVAQVLTDALGGVIPTLQALSQQHPIKCQAWSNAVCSGWVNALRLAFAAAYANQAECRYEIYGGKPEGDVESLSNSWHRWEYLHDVCVLEMRTIQAAYHATPVPVAWRAIWQVESEMAGDGSAVAEDASKLRMGSAPFKLLIVAETDQHDRCKWRRFLGELSRDDPAEWFLGIMPTYASVPRSSNAWRDLTVSLTLYRCGADGSFPVHIETLAMPAARIGSDQERQGETGLAGMGTS